jgi:hypothetical protein
MEVNGMWKISEAIPLQWAVTTRRWEAILLLLAINNYTIGNFSTASGSGNTTSGYAATAFGQNNVAEGAGSVALGYLATASGPRSIAIGHGATASGINSTSIGFSTRSGGLSSLATGYDTDASGHYSTAMGSNAHTNDKEGAFVIGDKSQGHGYVESSAPNKFTARFANGYLLYTSADMTDFVALGPGGNAWITSSDSTRKTNFEAADGEQFLTKAARPSIWEAGITKSRMPEPCGTMARWRRIFTQLMAVMDWVPLETTQRSMLPMWTELHSFCSKRWKNAQLN